MKIKKEEEDSKLFGIGQVELMVFVGIALLIFGPKQLPKLAKSLGSGIKDFKEGMKEAKQELNEATGFLNEAAEDINATLDLKDPKKKPLSSKVKKS